MAFSYLMTLWVRIYVGSTDRKGKTLLKCLSSFTLLKRLFLPPLGNSPELGYNLDQY